MNILLSNDDGFNAEGIKALSKILSKYHDVYIVAPNTQKSAFSQALTIRDDILVCKIDNADYCAKKIFSVEGSPADCVKLAITTLLSGDEFPDIVISGVNHGPNLGYDVSYSGTVAAALEAARLGIRSIAVSIVAKEWEYDDFIYPAKFISDFILNLPDIGNKTVLNINIPKAKPCEIGGVVYTCLAGRVFTSEYELTGKIKEGSLYKLIGVPAMDNQSDMTDIQAIRTGHISITPLNFDMTDTTALKKLSETLVNS